MGIKITVGRSGSAIGNIAQPFVYEGVGNNLSSSFWVGAGFVAFSLICGIFVCIIDKYGEKKDAAEGVKVLNIYIYIYILAKIKGGKSNNEGYIKI